ncbi:type 4b pilus protein PilO2 [Marinobacterium sp. BA1]|uniref:type 4b pilus protein PilO2 n=1 Tax=Marinobacterium sp. BA1 TaxID=3138931 RepID=UPI0032E6C84B
MPSKFFNYDGEVFAAGLFWQPVNGDSRKEKPSLIGVGPETRKTARRLDNCTHIAWRNGDTPHIGFLDKISPNTKEERNAKSSAYILAESISKLHPHARSFIAVFEIQDVSESMWLLVAQHDRIILADGDMHGSEDEVLAHFHQMLSLPMSWDLLIAPDHWGITNASTDITFDGLLKEAEASKLILKQSSLKPIKRSRKKLILSAICVLSLIALAVGSYKGIVLFQNYKDLQNNPAKELPPPPPPPWTREPSAEDAIDACVTGVLNTEWVIGNWRLDAINCLPTISGGSITANFLRAADGWVSHAQEAVPDITFSNKGENGQIVHQLPPFDASKSSQIEQSSFPSRSVFDLNMRRYSQELGIQIEVGAPRAAPPITGRPDLPRPTWSTIDWSIRDTMVTPNILVEPMSNPGLRIKKVSASLSNGSLIWNIEGTQYAK